MEMLGGVFVFRGVTAAYVPALQTQAQVDPSIPHFQAFLASASVRRHLVKVIHVGTGLYFPLSFQNALDSDAWM